MHYYKFNIPTWDQATYHLLPEELGVYIKLMNRYYDTEKPLPEDIRPVLRKLQLLAFEATVEQILSEFFVLTDKGWFHKKCSAEIKNYHKNAKINKINGCKGGRPAKTKANSVTEKKPDGFPAGYDSVSEKNPNHKPITNNHKPIPKGINPVSWNEFEQHRKEMREPLTDLARTKAMNVIMGLPFCEQTKIIDKTIQNRWKGLFLEKPNEAHKPAHESSHAQVMRRLSERIDNE